jgi:hypothetical protein
MKKEGYLVDDRAPFLKLIDDAYEFKIIDKDLRDDFHHLRKIRNLVHLSSISYQEHKAYNIKETNHYIQSLNNFIKINTK